MYSPYTAYKIFFWPVFRSLILSSVVVISIFKPIHSVLNFCYCIFNLNFFLLLFKYARLPFYNFLFSKNISKLAFWVFFLTRRVIDLELLSDNSNIWKLCNLFLLCTLFCWFMLMLTCTLEFLECLFFTMYYSCPCKVFTISFEA